MQTENYRFPINAALNDSAGGFIELKKDAHRIYLKNPSNKDARQIQAVKSPAPTGPSLSKILDLRSIQMLAKANLDAKFLVVTVDASGHCGTRLDTV